MHRYFVLIAVLINKVLITSNMKMITEWRIFKNVGGRDRGLI